MIANYHTHTYRCNHASGEDEEYVQSALEAGIEILGFSDHTPYFFHTDKYSRFRMRPELFPGYCQSIERLKNDYRGKVEIHLGVEAEYYPALFPELLAYLQENGVEHLLLGQHYTKNEQDGVYSGRVTTDPEVLKTYCYQTMDAMNTGLFTYFAHPDLICFEGKKETYQQYMRQVVREAKSCNVPLEMNLLGIREDRHYPNSDFWEIVAEENCPVIIGADAHTPEVFASTLAEEKALAWLKELGLTPMQTIPLRKIT